VKWLQSSVNYVSPLDNVVLTNKDEPIYYDHLVVASGIQLNWSAIPGLQESLGKNGVCSNYDSSSVSKTAEFLKDFKGGIALFTQPATPIKCAGAPQKIAYLAEEILCKNGIREKSDIIFNSGMGSIFAVKKYADQLAKICSNRDIQFNPFTNLIAVDGNKKQATFKINGSGENAGNEIIQKFDFLHAVPPMVLQLLNHFFSNC